MQRFSPRFRSMQFFDVRDNVWSFLWSRHACGCKKPTIISVGRGIGWKFVTEFFILTFPIAIDRFSVNFAMNLL